MQFRGSHNILAGFVLFTLLITLFGAGALCQDTSPVNIVPRFRPTPERRESSIRLDVKMVMIPANVTDREDRPIMDLHRENFHVFEDAVEQKIESFSIDQAPVSLGIVFDASGSMRNKIDESFSAVDQFLKTSLPGDEFFLVQFSDVPKLRVPFTPDVDEITTSLSLVKPQGWTAMFDAIYVAVNQMRRAKNPRKALLILSDGGDNNSRYSGGEVINLLREADVRVYAIGLFDNAHYLKKAAEDTGGAMVTVHNMNDLPDAIDKLSIQLRSQYLLGYYPVKVQNDGKFHKVKVLVSQAAGSLKLHTSWRHGYYAPD
jgi:Ca-activated chloride channel family protein